MIFCRWPRGAALGLWPCPYWPGPYPQRDMGRNNRGQFSHLAIWCFELWCIVVLIHMYTSTLRTQTKFQRPLKNTCFTYCLGFGPFLLKYRVCSLKEECFLESSAQNHAESCGNDLKNLVLDPKRAKFDQKSDFAHVRTYSWLHKLRNTQGNIHGTYLGNIYGIYKECITNISIDIYDIK